MSPFVSTGRLPSPEDVEALVDEAHRRYRTVDAGEVSSVYPALARVSRDLFGICVAGTSGAVYAVGDDGAAGANGLGGYDLLSPNDRVLP